jgi:hypothetical protein
LVLAGDIASGTREIDYFPIGPGDLGDGNREAYGHDIAALEDLLRDRALSC